MAVPRWSAVRTLNAIRNKRIASRAGSRTSRTLLYWKKGHGLIKHQKVMETEVRAPRGRWTGDTQTCAVQALVSNAVIIRSVSSRRVNRITLLQYHSSENKLNNLLHNLFSEE